MDERSKALIGEYDAILANRRATYGPPLLSEFDEVVRNLRSISISGSVSLKRVRASSVTSSMEREEVRVHDSSDDESNGMHEMKLGQQHSPAVNWSTGKGEAMCQPLSTNVGTLKPTSLTSLSDSSFPSSVITPSKVADDLKANKDEEC